MRPGRGIEAVVVFLACPTPPSFRPRSESGTTCAARPNLPVSVEGKASTCWTALRPARRKASFAVRDQPNRILTRFANANLIRITAITEPLVSQVHTA
jgi:hypothetical protein